MRQRHLVVHADAVGAQTVDVVRIAAREALEPDAADELRARPAGEVGQVLVTERDPPVQVEADRGQVDVLEHVAQPLRRGAHLLDLRPQPGLQALVLDRERGGAADGVDQPRLLVGDGRVHDRRHHLAVVLDRRRHRPAAPLGRSTCSPFTSR